VEITRKPGDAVTAGDSLLAIEPSDAELEVVAFVDAAVAKRIRAGMGAEVAPTSIRREEYGMLRSDVSRVGSFPTTPEYLQATLRNPSVAEKILAKGPVTEVRARLRRNRETHSGYDWTTSTGPGFVIDGGTLVDVDVIVERRRPITLVMPFLRRTIGLA
jgi:HlyD family secretion protein